MTPAACRIVPDLGHWARRCRHWLQHSLWSRVPQTASLMSQSICRFALQLWLCISGPAARLSSIGWAIAWKKLDWRVRALLQFSRQKSVSLLVDCDVLYPQCLEGALNQHISGYERLSGCARFTKSGSCSEGCCSESCSCSQGFIFREEIPCTYRRRMLMCTRGKRERYIYILR